MHVNCRKAQSFLAANHTKREMQELRMHHSTKFHFDTTDSIGPVPKMEFGSLWLFKSLIGV